MYPTVNRIVCRVIWFYRTVRFTEPFAAPTTALAHYMYRLPYLSMMPDRFLNHAPRSQRNRLPCKTVYRTVCGIVFVAVYGTIYRAVRCTVCHTCLLRGTMLNRTNGDIKPYIFPIFFTQYLVLLTMVPRNTISHGFSYQEVPHRFVSPVDPTVSHTVYGTSFCTVIYMYR